MADYLGQIVFSLPGDKIFQQLPMLNLKPPRIINPTPFPMQLTFFLTVLEKTLKSPLPGMNNQNGPTQSPKTINQLKEPNWLPQLWH